MKPAPIPHRQILKLFEDAGPRAYTATQLAAILSEHRQAWHLPRSFNSEQLTEYLETRGKLQRVELTSAAYTGITRLVWGELTPYQLALTVRKGAFLSHATAAFLHDLNEQISHTIYINAEQSEKPSRGKPVLSQEAIDRAFRAPQRTSKLVYEFKDWKIVVLAGKNTGRLEVGAVTGPNDEQVEATNLERTLIDLTVRPAYAGGPQLVLDAFKRAVPKVSTPVLLATLKRFRYVYPYHQAVGFYMQRAGYPPKAWRRFSELGLDFSFYLVHGMKQHDFVEDWRLFIPKGF